MFYIGLGLIFTVFCVTLLYLMLVGKGRLKSDRNRRLDDETQMEFIKRYNAKKAAHWDSFLFSNYSVYLM